ncbi:MAG TPA: hypothetical protein VFX59_22430, partial [Polyangiales bacterium]|nr:hypothetical protein [Polyangiales bacterium]
MKSLLTCLVASTLLVAACGGEDNESPEPSDNGNAVDAAVSTPLNDAATPGDAGVATSDAGWKSGQKIPVGEMWNSGSDGASREWAKTFGDWRGRPTTSTWLNLLYLPWEWIAEPGLLFSLTGADNDRAKVWEAWGDYQGVVALSMSMAGNSEVSEAEYF